MNMRILVRKLDIKIANFICRCGCSISHNIQHIRNDILQKLFIFPCSVTFFC